MVPCAVCAADNQYLHNCVPGCAFGALVAGNRIDPFDLQELVEGYNLDRLRNGMDGINTADERFDYVETLIWEFKGRRTDPVVGVLQPALTLDRQIADLNVQIVETNANIQLMMVTRQQVANNLATSAVAIDTVMAPVLAAGNTLGERVAQAVVFDQNTAASVLEAPPEKRADLDPDSSSADGSHTWH